MSWYKNPITWYALLSGLGGIVGIEAHYHPAIAWLAICNAVLAQILGYITERNAIAYTKNAIANGKSV